MCAVEWLNKSSFGSAIDQSIDCSFSWSSTFAINDRRAQSSLACSRRRRRLSADRQRHDVATAAATACFCDRGVSRVSIDCGCECMSVCVSTDRSRVFVFDGFIVMRCVNIICVWGCISCCCDCLSKLLSINIEISTFICLSTSWSCAHFKQSARTHSLSSQLSADCCNLERRLSCRWNLSNGARF